MKMKEFFKLKNYYYYLQGNLRYLIYYKYKKLKFLVPNYIWEQIEIRINSMDKKCYKSGQCKICGCKTTALQFANKPCDKPCYPKMFNKKEWLQSLIGEQYCNITNRYWNVKKDKFYKTF